MRFSRDKILQIKRFKISHIDKFLGFQSLFRQRTHKGGRRLETVDDADIRLVFKEFAQFRCAVAEKPKVMVFSLFPPPQADKAAAREIRGNKINCFFILRFSFYLFFSLNVNLYNVYILEYNII